MARPLLLAIALLAPIMLSQPAAAEAAAPHVTDAWVRLPAASGRPAGGYFTAHGTSAADMLVAVTSPKAERIEMHSMTMDGGVMRMRAETGFALPAGGELKLAPGGNHLMLFGLAPDVKPGSKLPLTFSFKSGSKVTLDAVARAAADPAKPAASGHQH
ncbi:MAG: copper chaperone PCu(A)C [Sandaracinobacteroides sp.]